MTELRFNKTLLLANALVPLGLLAYDASQDRLGANPIEFFLQTTGVLTLVFLTLTLAVTPARKILGYGELVRYRRMLGLLSFLYASLHLVTYSVFDKSLSLPAIATDVGRRPFIALGMAAFVLLIPLAITSTNAMVRRLGGRNWSRLHKLTYVIAVFGVVHFWMIVKSDVFYPAIFAALVGVLLIFRVYEKAAGKVRARNVRTQT